MELSSADVASIVIGSSGLFLALYGAYATRRHNYLSVKPVLQFGWTAGETGDGLWIKNAGLGPAIVTRFIVNRDTVPIESREIAEVLVHAGFESRMTVISSGSVIQEKEQRWIVRSKEFLENSDDQYRFWAELAGLEFVVEYRSLYDTTEPTVMWKAPNPLEGLVLPKGHLAPNAERDVSAPQGALVV